MARRIFFGGKPDEKSPFQGEKCGFDVANAHKFLKISDWYCKMIQNIKNIKKSVDKQGGIVYNRYCCEGHNETKSQNKVLKTTNQLKGSIAQLGEHLPYKQRVTGSSPVVPTIICGCSSSGRAPPCQGGGSEFEPRNPLQYGAIAKW